MKIDTSDLILISCIWAFTTGHIAAGTFFLVLSVVALYKETHV